MQRLMEYVLYCRVSKRLKTLVVEEAKERGVSINELCTDILEAYFREKQNATKTKN